MAEAEKEEVYHLMAEKVIIRWQHFIVFYFNFISMVQLHKED